MKDQFGRTIQYLRVSVTDKCNLRCVYCMPVEGLPWLPREDLLTYEEIAQIISTLAPMGLQRVRITGGEPLVRRDVPELARMLSAIEGIRDLSLSTNAVLLADEADALRSAGVHRLNVSLDSLRPDRVDAISRRPGSFPKIMAGLDAAERVGFAPIKINVVLIRGSNDDEIADFAEITRERPWHVRFIEMMPTGANLDVSAKQFVSCNERAWHAGVSCFAGREQCNDFSLGIELEGTDELPYSDAQYATLQTLSRELMRVYPGISRERICGHSDIAPGRKTDPGPAFDWCRYLDALGTERPA